MTERLFPWRSVVAPWLASRLLVDLAFVIGSSSLFGSPLGMTSGFTDWDFGWYRRIAEIGYGAPPMPGVQSPWPFFPLFPGVIRVGGWLGISSGLTAFMVNHLVFLIAVAGIYRLASLHLSKHGARLSVWALVLFPGSVSFSLGYPSAIFLAASVWAFWHLEKGNYLGAGALGVVATMVRPNGILVAASMGLFILHASRFKSQDAWRRAIGIGLPSAIALGAWCWQLDRWTGDPFAFWTAKAAWSELTILEFVQTRDHDGFVHVAMAGVAAVVVALAWKRLPISWLVMVGAYLIPPGLFAVVGLGRYANESFPVVIAAGDTLDRFSTRVQKVLLGASSLALAGFAIMVVRYRFVP